MFETYLLRSLANANFIYNIIVAGSVFTLIFSCQFNPFWIASLQLVIML